MVKALFFDIHEVITHGEFRLAYKTFADKVGISDQLVADYHQENFSSLLTGSLIFEHMLLALGLDTRMDVPQMMKEWESAIISVMTVDENMITLLTQLKEQYVLAALTNLTETRLLPDIALHIYNYFDYQILSYKEGVRKPDVAFFERALEKTGFLAQEVIFIDDQVKNVAAAESVGIQPILFTDYDTLIKSLHKHGVVV
jgi:HAD superfamily hydrolase (TIGR01509 family)